jgi:hypothetical protein
MPVEDDGKQMEIKWQRVVYTVEDRKLSKVTLTNSDVQQSAGN